uniref:Calcium regulated heat stable protein 1 n=1 Tax=Naja naja TaxID=35670 RepID=A0A8C6Y581_NAJNA
MYILIPVYRLCSYLFSHACLTNQINKIKKFHPWLNPAEHSLSPPSLPPSLFILFACGPYQRTGSNTYYHILLIIDSIPVSLLIFMVSEIQTTRAAEGPTYSGVCKCFCRSKGHGFITPADGGPEIFVHISDIEGEYVPVAGDEVTYKVCTIPPKNEKLQAVEVNITHLAPGTKHETWSGHVINS